MKISIRKAKIQDIPGIARLINNYARSGFMLTVKKSWVKQNIDNFQVASESSKIVGCCLLFVFSPKLAEIRSLAVLDAYKGKNIGSRLVKTILKKSRILGIERVFLLTAIPEFFIKLGFKKVNKNIFPQKIWKDCIKCKKFRFCDEIALLKE